MNLLALPFYATLDEQTIRGRCGAFATPTYSPPDRFIPFVVRRPATGQGLDCILVYDAASGSLVTTIEPDRVAYRAFTNGTYDYYVYYGAYITGLQLACGTYYLGVKGSYSETFNVSDDVSELLRLEWRNGSDIEELPYSIGFNQRVYIDAELGQLEYPYTEEGDKDGNGLFVPMSRTLTKTWNFDTQLLPEYFVDVVQSLSLHDTVRIGNHAGVTNIKIKLPTWAKDDCAASAAVEFSEPPVLAANCAPALPWQEIDTTDYVPKTWLCGTSSPTPFWEDTGLRRCVTAANTYASAPISEDVAPNNCPAGATPQPVTYTLIGGYFTSTASQADADQQARIYFDSQKQAYANANGTCVTRKVYLENVAQYAKGVKFAVTRTDTIGDCYVDVSVEVTVDDAGYGSGEAQSSKTIKIPAGTATTNSSISTGGFVVTGITLAEITAVNPADYDF